MSYQSLYRKWRSQGFDEVLGQDHITRTLKNAIIKGRVAHAFLFAGPRGTGKTSTARILAKALNCEQGPTSQPDLTCPACQRIRDGQSLDVLEIDAASNRGIDEIRELRERVRFAPVEGPYKIYIIDEVHMLTSEAFNALLKTLEEPPEHVVFILCTTDWQKLPATILSRCQRYDFRRIPQALLAHRLGEIVLAEGAGIEPDALDLIVAAAAGSFRDAESILEQLLSYTEGTVTATEARELLGFTEEEWLTGLAESLLAADFKAIFNLLGQLIEAGRDPRNIGRDLVQFLRHLLAISVGSPTDLWRDRETRLRQIAAQTNPGAILQLLDPLAGLEAQMRQAVEPRTTLEMTLILAAYRSRNGKSTVGAAQGLTESPSLKNAEEPTTRTQTVKKVEPASSSADSAEEMETKPATAKAEAPPTLVLSRDPAKLSLAEIQAQWAHILEGVRTQTVPMYVLLSKGTPVDYEDGCLTICFDRQFTFHRNTVSLEENKVIIEKAIQHSLGCSLQLAFLLKDGEKEQTEENLRDHPMVQQALDLFEGNIIEIKEV
ncbi:MAG: DNA polymerase III subunit gamma/tau [Coprothermobacterota bacterium]|nr:DNA polymerase III subunit gamma/tau [Coprothermobacterota bacterium]